MQCSACGTENRPDRRFCRTCGTPLGATCPVCGAANEPGDRFCGACGSALDGTSRGPAAPSTVAPPGAAASSWGAAQPTPAGSLEGGAQATERRLVSVLFADLVGSTTLAEGQDVEAVREALGRYYETAREVVGRYGGAIEKFIGDAVMAVWGSPVAHEDDAERAVRAGLDLLEAVGLLPGPSGGPLAARAAVLTGEAAVSLDAEGQGMVAGDLVNTASRLQSLAPAASVLVDEATVRASEAAVAYEPAGEQVLRGRTAPVSAWRALRVVAGRRGSGRAARLEAPFVGRDDELRLLKEVFHQTARERRPRLVSITGIAGIGKSRLAWEVEKYIDGLVETVYWHQGRSPAYGDGLAFWALGEMVRGRARIAETDDPAAARAKLGAMAADLLPDAEERERVEPRLAALLGLEPSPPGGAEELTAAWRTLFERVADRGPTILVFEDLHWAEPGLLDFIEGLLAAARSRPILVVALARPELMERRPTWGAAVRNHLRLDLAPLDDEGMDLLLLGLAPGIPQEALRAIRRRAEGVPLYAVETVRMLLDQGRLTETDGRFRLVGDLGQLAIPDSMQALLGARLDALEPGSRELVGHAAVLGISFTADAVAALADRPVDHARSTLDGLVDRELLVFDDDPRSAERGQYRFIQGVLREVAYARLSRRERVARHLAAAAHFEALGSDELAGVVASHHLEAVRSVPDPTERVALAPRARSALESAASRSHAMGAYGSAAGYLADAIELADGEEERLALREARLRELYEAQDAAAEAEARALIEIGRVRRDPGLQARAGWILAGALVGGARPVEAVADLTALHDELGSFATEDPDGLRLTAELARCHLMAGDAATATTLIDETLPVVERLGLRDAIAELLPSKGWALGAQGRFMEAGALLRGAMVFAEGEGNFRAEMRSRMNYTAWAGWEDIRESFEVARTGVERALARGYRGWAVPLAGNACDMALYLGEWDWIASMVATLGLDESGAPWEQGPVGSLTTVRAYQGRTSEAAELLEHAQVVAGGFDDPQMQLTLRSVEGQVALAAGDLGAALAATEEAMRLGEVAGLGEDPLYGFVALERRDAQAAAAIGQASRGGRVRDALLDGFAAGAAALGGDPSRLEEMDRAASVIDDIGGRFLAAQLRRARALVAPDDQGARPAAERAAAVFAELGAVTMFRGLESLLPQPAAAPRPVGTFEAAAAPSSEVGATEP